MKPRWRGWIWAGVLALVLRASAAVPITSLDFHPAGDVVLVGRSRAADLVPVDPDRTARRLPVDLPQVTAARFVGDGSTLVVAGGTPGVGGAVLHLESATGRELGRWTRDGDVVTAVAVAPSGKGLAVAAESAVHLVRFPFDSSGPGRALTGHSAPVRTVAFSADGSLLVSAGADRSVKVWSAETGAALRSFGQHTEPVLALAFAPGAGVPTCATGGEDRTVRVWQPGLGRMVRIVRQPTGGVLALRYTPDGQSLYSAGTDGQVRRIDAASDEVLRSWAASTDWVYALAVSPDGRTVGTGDAGGTVALWTADGQPVRRLPPEGPTGR